MTASAKHAETTKSPFLAIERDANTLKDLARGNGQFVSGGMLWRTGVSKEVGRLASQARMACGEQRKWAEVQDLARQALGELDVIAERHAEQWRSELGRPMTATSIIDVHGPADVLAWGLLWTLQNRDTGTLRDRPPATSTATSGHHVLAAFALLMIDHAVYDMAKGRSVSALEFLSIAGSALAYATMDKAQSDAAKQLFQERSARGLAGAKGKWSSISEHQTEALRMANEGHYKSRIDAARTIAQNLVKASPEGKDEFYTPETIDGWLKNAGWKTTP